MNIADEPIENLIKINTIKVTENGEEKMLYSRTYKKKINLSITQLNARNIMKGLAATLREGSYRKEIFISGFVN
jgi:hypothetical protein